VARPVKPLEQGENKINMVQNCNLTIGTAIANRSGAMEADTISKNGRSSKSQMSRINSFAMMSKTTVMMFALFALGILNSQIAVAQTRSMGSAGILGRLQNIIDYAEERDMEVVRIEADIIRTTKEIFRTLDPSFSYIIVAVGSNRIKDIDIEVYKKVNSEWILVKKDDDEKDIAVVNISPSSYAEYKIVVKVYRFYSDYDVGHYGLVIYHD